MHASLRQRLDNAIAVPSSRCEGAATALTWPLPSLHRPDKSEPIFGRCYRRLTATGVSPQRAISGQCTLGRESSCILFLLGPQS
jgi:hypothetical protein